MKSVINNICFICFVLYFYKSVESKRDDYPEVVNLVAKWSTKIGERLKVLSETMTREQKVEDSFKSFEEHLVDINGAILTEGIARDIRILMDDKVRAVKSIAGYAEFLSYHRKEETDEFYNNYFYFNADNITNNERNHTQEEEIAKDVCQAECAWWCAQRNLNTTRNDFTKEDLQKLFNITSSKSFKAPSCGSDMGCECTNREDDFRGDSFYTNLPLQQDKRFDNDVNFNVSVLKIATNVYHRERQILEGIRWSEALDFVFKYNFARDPELTWQYFASPRGFMRHYPAVKWSNERYDKTYDFRTRSWFTEAMTSPKDMIILLDNSGSMMGMRRALSHQIVNDILDTLNDNDFVNIILFNNETKPLVNCFNYSLVQANEENLRLLRENLPVYLLEFTADLTIGMKKAFDILERFRNASTSTSKCNQAIMLITEGIDYTFDIQVFNKSNWQRKFPVRIFTYQLGSNENDAKEMEYIACANKGYYVNTSLLSDVREKVLNYLSVMSRPINLEPEIRQVPIWSYLYVDLADRRLPNWIWRKKEGIRQREVFLDHVKRDIMRRKKIMTGKNYMLLQRTHEFEKYENDKKQNYSYMTTVSMPVYGKRRSEYDLIGVAGIDVPIKLFKTKIPHDLLGVNGYAFIVTNNGYVILHPDHRPEFEKILKPTFNRVDILETEIYDNDSDVPRQFRKKMQDFRKTIVHREQRKFKYTVQDVFRDNIVHDRNLRDAFRLNVKYTLHEMKRLMKVTNYYYFAAIGPFTLGIVLPDRYGFTKFNVSVEGTQELVLNKRFYRSLVLDHNWKVHPEWVYVKSESVLSASNPRDKIILSFFDRPEDKLPLFYKLMHDFNITQWFSDGIKDEHSSVSQDLTNRVHKVFLATWSGLTRYKTFKSGKTIIETDTDSFETRNNRAIDEDWYRRAVEENFKDESIFIYSVPFEISIYEENTMITGVKAVFIEKESRKTPVAVVGIQFRYQAMVELYQNITMKNNLNEALTCNKSYALQCFILDNNAYIVVSDVMEYTGKFLGDIRPDIMQYLAESVYYMTEMYDYQGICQPEPPKPAPRKECPKRKKKPKNNASNLKNTLSLFISNINNIAKWAYGLITYYFTLVYADPDYESNKEETLAFERIKIPKTLPTPCDKKFTLFNLRKEFKTFKKESHVKFECSWPYAVHKIPYTNLVFLAINGGCKQQTENITSQSPEPKEIPYSESLPCYIATFNNYSKRVYMNCYNRNDKEDMLNVMDRWYCGHTWT